jgi:hypothetical protein
VISSLTHKILGSGRLAFVAAVRSASLRESRDERAPSAICEAPAWAKEVAMAKPMPRDAPTMKTLLLRGAGLERDEMAG